FGADFLPGRGVHQGVRQQIRLALAFAVKYTSRRPLHPGVFEAANPSVLTALPDIIRRVKARVFVSLKKTVLDPQGQTVRSALTGLGYQSVSDVRQGKFFEIALAPGTSR